MRIGFIGTENSHVKHFIRFLNIEERYPGTRAVALAGGQSEHNSELAEYGSLDVIVEDPADLVGHIDAAIVCNRDGGLHRRASEPLIEAGLPVLVDKPLATSIEDAQALLELADKNGSLLVSASALRSVPEMPFLTKKDADIGSVKHLHVVGPADPDSEYAGLFFYGIHHVEAALQILGNPIIEPGELGVHIDQVNDTVWATTTIAGTIVTLTFVVPQSGARTPFHATAVHAGAVRATELSLGPDYNAPALDMYLSAIKAGKSPLNTAQLLSPVVVMSDITQALEATR